MGTVLFLSILQKDIVNLVACLCALIEQTRVVIGTILSQYAKKTWECSVVKPSIAQWQTKLAYVYFMGCPFFYFNECFFFLFFVFTMIFLFVICVILFANHLWFVRNIPLKSMVEPKKRR